MGALEGRQPLLVEGVGGAAAVNRAGGKLEAVEPAPAEPRRQEGSSGQPAGASMRL